MVESSGRSSGITSGSELTRPWCALLYPPPSSNHHRALPSRHPSIPYYSYSFSPSLPSILLSSFTIILLYFILFSRFSWGFISLKFSPFFILSFHLHSACSFPVLSHPFCTSLPFPFHFISYSFSIPLLYFFMLLVCLHFALPFSSLSSTPYPVSSSSSSFPPSPFYTSLSLITFPPLPRT